MDPVTLVRSQYKGAHDLLEATMKDVTDEQAHWAPPGIANPLGATYVHVVGAEDFLLSSTVRGATPLVIGTWASASASCRRGRGRAWTPGPAA